jgi:hypothetical protein
VLLFSAEEDTHICSLALKFILFYTSLVAACNASSSVAAVCATYKAIIHPNLPGPAPLAAGPSRLKRSCADGVAEALVP